LAKVSLFWIHFTTRALLERIDLDEKFHSRMFFARQIGIAPDVSSLRQPRLN
jgi:hypothetical protein